MGAIADVQTTFYVDASLRKGFDFVNESGGIDEDTGAYNGVTAGAQNSARDELQNVAIGADDDGMACIVASGYARDIFERASQVVNYFTFSFVAPLRAYHHDRRHFWPFLLCAL